MPHASAGAAIRAFRAGDGPALATAWTAAAPGDGISYHRFRDLVLLDRNFDPAGLLVAERDGEIVGAAYGVRRRIAADGANLEEGTGWIPFFFVRPDARGRGIGRALVTEVLDWLGMHGAADVYFSSYTPNYFLPGLDARRYPEAAALLASLGFTRHYDCVAMDMSLNDYTIPPAVAERAAALRRAGYIFDSPSDDDLVELIELAGGEFNPDWGRVIREEAVAGFPLERILCVRDPRGTMLGWAMCGAYENVLERFGPFGVLAESRGTGLGKVLLHLTLERMRALGAHSAWFLWTDLDSPAGHLYLATGFTVTRTFTVLRNRRQQTIPGGTDE